MNNKDIFNILQFAGGTFPGGGFSQSWGLETYVAKGIIKDVESLNDFLSMYLDSVIAGSEIPIMVAAMNAYKKRDYSSLEKHEELSVASKLTKESRESALRMGKSFLRISQRSIDEKSISDIYKKAETDGMTYSVAYGIVMAHLGLTEEDAAGAYAFNTVNAIIQSAVKLIPLGNSEAQTILQKLQSEMNDSVVTGMSIHVDDITTFCPGLDIAGMEHEVLGVRLYMT